MEKINYRFLNYKRYSKFLEDLNNNKVREDAIVFIQDNLRIWARGKEYVCDGPSATKIKQDTLTFTNGTDNTVMTIRSADGALILTDSDGRTISTTYVLDENFQAFVNTTNNYLEYLRRNIDANRGELADVAFSGDYNDLINTPQPPTIDDSLSSTSYNAVQNKVIYEALNSKANASDLSSYVLTSVYNAGMETKQNKLTAGSGISIDSDNKISTTIDTELYIVVTEKPDIESADPNKIYLVETPNGDGTYRYEQYRLRNGRWVLIGNATPNINLDPYLKSADAQLLYQPKRDDYVLQGDLNVYAKLTALQAVIDSLANYVSYEYLRSNYQPIGEYATLRWVTDNFVKKEDVYTPAQPDHEIPGTITPIPGSDSSTSDTSAILLALQGKQDKLTAGDGISIENNVISSTLDTNVFLIVNSLENVSTPNENKIYLLETVENGETVYIEYRWRNNAWVEIGRKDIDIDLTDYAKLSDLTDYTLTQDFEDYKTWAENTYAKSQIIVQPSTPTITVDTELNINSANPVENRVVTTNLNLKADKSELRSYATKEELNSKVDNMDLTAYVTNETYTQGLAGKQDTLTPGRGISIVNNTISSTLDTDVFVIVNSLPSQGNPNKIYLVETVENDEVTYVEWRWRYDESTDTWDWVEIGQKDPGIDLTDYLTKTEAASTYITEATADGKYQLKGDYMTRSEAQTQHNTLSNLIEALRDELEDDYVTDDQLDALQLYIRQTFQRKGNYVLAEDVSTALNVLQQVIDQKYVLKRDVYNPNNPDGWSTTETTTISVSGSNGGTSTGTTGVQNNMVTLTTQQYQLLVDNNLVDESTYYFTYEEEETTNWTFGGTFPITLGGSDSLGVFPINLT